MSRSFEQFKVAASGHSSEFDQKSDFLLRHRYGKTTASVQTTRKCLPDAIFDKARRGEE
jgi:hypothetical protein